MKRREFLEAAAAVAVGIQSGPRPAAALESQLSAQSDLPVSSGRLHVGWSAREITPPQPVALSGQFHKRISTHVFTPLWATALALEVRADERVVDQAILVSCDLVGITDTLQPRLRERLKDKLEGFDLCKLLLNATHTHTGPVTGENWYEVTEAGVMKPADYLNFLIERLTEAVSNSWQNRRPGGVNCGLGYATVGYNRRMVYADGHAAMYGRNDGRDFRRVEGYEDSTVETLFFWNEERKLTGVGVNVPCPSQVLEAENYISSDFWHDVRAELRHRLSQDLYVLAWTGAAGDLSPHPQIRRDAEARMRKMRGGVSETRAIALRIADAVEYAYGAVRNEVWSQVPFVHHIEGLRLPARKITETDYQSAKSIRDRLAGKPRETWDREDYARLHWYQGVVDRYENPSEHAIFTVDLHVLRLGDVAIASNPFELFLDYGIQMKTRSKALQTFLIQLAGGEGGYLPTEKAVAGGGYSAVAESGLVGPEGGQMLVERTVEIIARFWQPTS